MAQFQEQIRDRIVEMVEVESKDLVEHDLNYKHHTSAQKNAMKGVLSEIGSAAPVIVYKSERAGGKYVIIDGHMRKSLGGKWKACVTDLTDEEADKLLAVFDPIAAMAHTDSQMWAQLADSVNFTDKSVQILLDGYGSEFGTKFDRGNIDQEAGEEEGESKPKSKKDEGHVIPEMELQPYEHYDYVLVLAKNVMDWNWLVEKLGLQKVNGSTDPRYTKVGLGRAISADKIVSLLRQAEETLNENEKLKQQIAKLKGKE